MKAKIGRGSGFRGVLDYALGKGDGELVGGIMVGRTPRQLANEFSAVRKLRPDVKRPVWHCSLSLPKGEERSSDDWDTIAADFMQRMEFSDDTPWVAVRHNDTDHDHIHIVASRVNLSGEVWHGKWEARRAIKATQVLERFYCLEITPGLNGPKAAKPLSKEEIEMALRTKKEPPRQALQRLVKEVASDGATALQFAERLVMAGVGVRANIASTGRLSGFSFEYDGIAFKGSQLGKGYGWSALQKEFGISYEQDRDSEGLKQLSGQAGGDPDLEKVAEGVARRKRDAERRKSASVPEKREPERREPPVKREDRGVNTGNSAPSERIFQGNEEGEPVRKVKTKPRESDQPKRKQIVNKQVPSLDFWKHLRRSFRSKAESGAWDYGMDAEPDLVPKIDPEVQKLADLVKRRLEMTPRERALENIENMNRKAREQRAEDAQKRTDYDSELKSRSRSPVPGADQSRNRGM